MTTGPLSDSGGPPSEIKPPFTGSKRRSWLADRARHPVTWAAAGLVLLGGAGVALLQQQPGVRDRAQTTYCGLVTCAVASSAALTPTAGTETPRPAPALLPPVAPSQAPAPAPTPTPARSPSQKPVVSAKPSLVPAVAPAPNPSPTWAPGPPRSGWPSPWRPGGPWGGGWHHWPPHNGWQSQGYWQRPFWRGFR